MTQKEPNTIKKPFVIISKELNKDEGKVLFPIKLAKANKALKKAGYPKIK